jgi:hypothetical protein
MTSPPPAHRMASTRKPPVSGTSDLFAISVLRSNSPQSDLHPNPARPDLASIVRISRPPSLAVFLESELQNKHQHDKNPISVSATSPIGLLPLDPRTGGVISLIIAAALGIKPRGLLTPRQAEKVAILTQARTAGICLHAVTGDALPRRAAVTGFCETFLPPLAAALVG